MASAACGAARPTNVTTRSEYGVHRVYLDVLQPERASRIVPVLVINSILIAVGLRWDRWPCPSRQASGRQCARREPSGHPRAALETVLTALSTAAVCHPFPVVWAEPLNSRHALRDRSYEASCLPQSDRGERNGRIPLDDVDLLARASVALQRHQRAVDGSHARLLNKGFVEDLTTVLTPVKPIRRSDLRSATFPHWGVACEMCSDGGLHRLTRSSLACRLPGLVAAVCVCELGTQQ